jgi:hypothetical protein
MVLEWLVSGLVLILLAIVGFSARRWFNHVDSLQASMENLRESILTLSDRFVTRDQYEKDREEYRANAGIGRRQMDRCPIPGCPYEDHP